MADDRAQLVPVGGSAPASASFDASTGRRISRERMPSIDDMPIPDDAQIDRSWTGQMREMAAHIGIVATLRIVAAFGGDMVYVHKDAARSPFADIVDQDTTEILAQIYGGSRLSVPVGKAALNKARRAGLIAAVRAGNITASDAARILRTSRTYLSHLVNATDEGATAAPALPLAAPKPRQLEIFED